MHRQSPDYGERSASERPRSLEVWAAAHKLDLRQFLGQFGITSNGKISPAPTHYQLLGVPVGAQEKEIVEALRTHRQLIAKLPERSVLRLRLELALENAQHDLIIDPVSRVTYDQQLQAHRVPASPLAPLLPELEKVLSHPPELPPPAVPVRGENWYERPRVIAGTVGAAIGGLLIAGGVAVTQRGKPGMTSDDPRQQVRRVPSDQVPKKPADYLPPPPIADAAKRSQTTDAQKNKPTVAETVGETREKVAAVAAPPPDPAPAKPELIPPKSEPIAVASLPSSSKPESTLPKISPVSVVEPKVDPAKEKMPASKGVQPETKAEKSEWEEEKPITLADIGGLIEEMRNGKDAKKLTSAKGWDALLQESAQLDPLHRVATLAAVYSMANGRDPDRAILAYESMQSFPLGNDIRHACEPSNMKMLLGLCNKQPKPENIMRFANNASPFVRDALLCEDFDGASELASHMMAFMQTSDMKNMRELMERLVLLSDKLKIEASSAKEAEAALQQGATGIVAKHLHERVARFLLRKGDATGAFIHFAECDHSVLADLAKRSLGGKDPDQNLTLARQWMVAARTYSALDPLEAGAIHFYRQVFPYCSSFSGADLEGVQAMAGRYWWVSKQAPKSWRNQSAVVDKAPEENKRLDLLTLFGEEKRSKMLIGDASLSANTDEKFIRMAGNSFSFFAINVQELQNMEFDFRVVARPSILAQGMVIDVPFFLETAEFGFGPRGATMNSSRKSEAKKSGVIHFDDRYILVFDFQVRRDSIRCFVQEKLRANPSAPPQEPALVFDWKAIPNDLSRNTALLSHERKGRNDIGIAIGKGRGQVKILEARVTILGPMQPTETKKSNVADR